MTLLAIILIPLIFAALVAAMPEANARRIAMFGMMMTLVVTAYGLFTYPWQIGTVTGDVTIDWLPALGLNLSVGADPVSMLLIALSALLGPICVAASTTAITTRQKTYYAWMLVLQAAMIGVFSARDIIFFYICFEFTLIPMFIMISLWGSTNRKKAAIKFFLYTFTGSVIALAGLVYVAWKQTLMAGSTGWTFDISLLQNAAQAMTRQEQAWVMAAMLLGFAVKVPLFPLHTWLPLAHTEAPTAGSVLLAGVLLKLGTYAIYRFVLPFTPVAVAEHATLLSGLCIVGILYGGLICWVQTDVKKLVAYSSVAHLGFCMLGMFALNATGIKGAILYMINHGLSTGALFLLIGMVYERYHTRSMKELGGLAGKMPVWSSFMVFFVMASVGLPGLNGFVSEFMCLFGAYQASSAWGSGLWGSTGGFAGGAVPGATPGSLGPWYALIAGFGMIVAAMYLLYMTGKVVWGTLVEPHGHGGHAGHGHDAHGALPTDLNRREIVTLLPLAILCVVLGVYPKPVLDVISTPVADTVQIIRSATPDIVPNTPPAAPPAPAAPAKAPGHASAVNPREDR